MPNLDLKDYINEQAEIYGKAVRTFIMSAFKFDKELSEDLAQETFIRAYRSLETSRKPIPLKNFHGYIKEICRNICIDECRRQSRLRKKDIIFKSDTDIIISDNNPSNLEMAYQKQIREMIMLDFPQILSAKEWDVVVIYTYESEKFSHIASRLNILETTARNRFFEAKKKLKAFLERRGICDTRGI